MSAGAFHIAPPSGESVVVSITTTSGQTPTVFSDEACTSSRTMPFTLSGAPAYFYVAGDDDYVLSVLVDGLENANGSGGTLAQRLDGSDVVTVECAVRTQPGVLRVKDYATAGRPDAVACGVGAVYFDTTLSKPAFSDGTVWRDAAGTAV